ncbi:ATP-binding protein [Lentibacter algarum]|uniref:ATP-binding protein n=1 Tax=Lentibacter algarum TaxID=576131 RepID=UPI001C07CAD4|nr:ATP-binding protein [Lentibacter algarum]MBU2981120.1 ATP-binding protein [Lentibacter algarum]
MFEFPGENLSVRHALAQLRHELSSLALSADDLGSIEIVLGEVLNNVVEHAYCEGASGSIHVSCVPSVHVLRFKVEDQGVMLPFEELPEGELPSFDRPLAALPEGGFGWYLVRNLACDLVYQRREHRNILAFSIPVEGCA